MIRSSASITLTVERDINTVWRYYALVPSAGSVPTVPEAYPPPSTIWSTSEPSYDGNSTQSLYTLECTVFSDGGYAYSNVCKSSSYEAAKAAYNKAANAQSAASAAQATADAKADPMTATAHGGEIAVSDSADAAIGGLVLYGKSTQNGTPSPANPVNIVTAGSGGALSMVSTGKNLLIPPDLTTPYTHAGITYSYDPTDGAIVLNGTASGTSNLHFGAVSGASSSNTQHIPNGRYVLSGGVSNNVYLTLWDGLDNTGTRYDDKGNTATMQITSGAIFNPRIVVLAGTVCNNLRVYPMIRPAAITDAAFAAYNGVTSAIPTPNGLPGIAVSSGGNYTDADGQQWICDTLDLAAGTYTKRVEVYAVTGSESVSKSSESTLDTYLMYFPTGTPSLVKGNTTFLCSHFRAFGTTKVGNAEIPTTGNYLRMRCHYASAGTSTVGAFKAAIAGMTVVYALAAPLVTPLTEAQLTALRSIRTHDGVTVLTNDAGADMDLVYATRTGDADYVESVRQGLDDDVNRAQNAADAAQAAAAAAAATADALDEIFRMWYSFTDEGMSVQKKTADGKPASIWSTLTDNTGFHILRSDLLEKVFSAYKDRCRVQKLVIGNTMVKPSGNGGMVWVKAPQD